MENRELAAGTRLQNGKYTIERVIGEGGFGITYYALHNDLGHHFAIKEFFIGGYCVRNTANKTLLLQGIDDSVYDKYLQKFIAEAQTLAKLDHPNIVKVVDIFRENNTAYLVMPFIEGQTLQQLVEQEGRLEYEVAVNYIAQLSEAVDYIHQRDMLHRDIKPENIIITPANKAILIDFGSAREFIHDKTQKHTSILTQGYAPLEQYSSIGRKGSYSDIYSLGAVFYFTLTGQKPMDATVRTMEEMPEPRALVAEIPEEANRTIMRAMGLRPEGRYQRVGGFMGDLVGEKIETESIDTDTSISPKKRHLIWKTAIVFLSLLLFGIVVYRQVNMMKENKEKAKIEAEEYYNKGREASKDGLRELAIEYYEKAISIDPNHANAYNNMGVAYGEQQNYTQAINCYQKAISIDPNHANAYNNMGVAYGEQQNYSQAISWYRKAISIDPNHAKAYYNMGRAYSDQQNHSQAISWYQKAISIDPNHANAYYNMGNAYYNQQNYSQAISWYRKAADLGSLEAQNWLKIRGYE
jgi:serine/threonine protein kinase